ncbi:MAG: tRNA(Ile)(2)-agmatinylcytidine synthase [Methanobrevibacter sp.]|uniref:tRNA(Ile)(2)-agmatinylcytidine synthase n=1 Tax=uncultured Methanobrevibacter sp. TaxID=253161 RepID=UPI0025FA691D|nr:tRNA(Ile)(2)-agmatinylcytidine synthase [uncultured Methanobrevibacter sp.]MEE1128971.1 tRNA(Ile)(2)-agmatinylcytidine synthase [Methanobrevibacter sp.]
MIVIKYLYIGIDDTDSPDGMCTTYLASQIINKFKDNGIELVDYPRLIRLNPFARFKTRGNGGVSLKILNDDKANLARKIVLNEVEKLSMFDCDNTNPGVIFYNGEITDEMKDYAFKAIHEFITIDEAEDFGKSVGCEIHKFKKGRGIIGSIAAISLPLEDFTFELLAYRSSENYGTKRKIDYDSVYLMDKKTFPDTFENIDYSEDYIAIEPKTPCPVLYGIRSNNVEALHVAKDIVKVDEPIVDWCIFKTNQHTDMHIQKADCILDMVQFGCYEVVGEVKNKPKIISGGHMFFFISDKSGEIECGAYEPTKNFRNVVSNLIPGDVVKVFGGIGEQNTFNIEKFQVLKLNDVEYHNPICECGKRMTSAGKNKGFKCKKCGNKIDSNEKVPIKITRNLKNSQFYETPVSARRHLSKPLCRMNL